MSDWKAGHGSGVMGECRVAHQLQVRHPNNPNTIENPVLDFSKCLSNKAHSLTLVALIHQRWWVSAKNPTFLTGVFYKEESKIARRNLTRAVILKEGSGHEDL
ncbi:hypothetical protein AVEN_231023-1 [Araneus ventricosus]|uniref:Uncharacterized protein n=1 Tax=Araneus ventricosus TaxID=182803 RepID=A0A4Y2A3X9_ARAVE|nr:hypothetical protein AVEN_231023-1 [Araneus ventricosus]